MVLVVQFRQDASEQHEQECIQRRLPQGQTARFVSIFDDTVDFANPSKLLEGVDKLVIGGSGAISIAPSHEDVDYAAAEHIVNTMEPLARCILANDFPTLGICFGHHVLAYFSGASVAYDLDQAETGAFELTLTPEGEMDPIFEGVPQRFSAIVGHQDSLLSVPNNATLLARSERCRAHMLRYGNNVYTTQFHSELDEKDLEYRLNLFPQYRDHAQGDSLQVPPSPFSVAPLINFLHY